MNTTAYLGFKDEDENPTAPLPKQVEATNMRGKYRFIGNFGSFGTGKTKWICLMMVIDANRYPGNDILTGRKKLSWFESSTLNDLLDAIPPELLIRHDKQKHNIWIRSIKANGEEGKPSVIRYRQLDASREALKEIKSMNLGMFAPDQAEEIEKEVWDAACGRLRRKNSARQALAAANPLGRNWIWKLFVDGAGNRTSIKEFGHALYGYVEARMWTKGVPAPRKQSDVTFAVSDNPYLPWDYITSLLVSYPEKWLNRYVFCEWGNFEGLVYPMWDDKVHLVKPFDIPDWWNRLIVLDHGHRNATAIGWIAISPDGDLFLYDLHYEEGHWVDHHAAVLKVKSERNGTELDDVWAWPADPSIFHQHMETTIADEYENEEIFWDRANNDLPGGVNRVATYLKIDPELKNDRYPEGKPRFFVFDIPETEPFRDEIKNYSWDEMVIQGGKNAPEKPRKLNDHAMDMLRYAINYIEDSEKPIKSTDPRWLTQQTTGKETYMSV